MARRCLLSARLSAGLAVLLAAVPTYAQDSDGDGISDAADAAPCDPAVAGAAFVPAEGQHGMMLFEDEWPYVADLDFNDVALTYNYALQLDAQGQVVSLRATYNVLAVGGVLTHGLALHLPVPVAAVAGATRTLAGGAPQALGPARPGDAEYTVDLVSDLRGLFGGQADPINAVPGWPKLSAPAIQVDIDFAAPVALDVATAPFDLFIFRVQTPAHEIHQPAYPGTARMDAALFGSGVDASGPGRWFVDGAGLPYALELPEVALYPQEAVPVSDLFPNIVGFAASGGASQQDFYKVGVSGADGYPGPNTPAFATVAPTADLSCLPAGAPCKDLFARGNTTSGVYLVDPDGAGGLTAFEVYCDMSLAGGGWTLISNRRANATNTEACGGNLQGFFTQGCGTPRNISAADSFALDATRRAAVITHATEVVIIQYLNGVADTDDAYIMTLPNPGTDLFVNVATVVDTHLPKVCTLDGSRCDTSTVYFKYTGDSWYHSSVCTAANWAGSTQYRGNYGLCHDAWTGASSSYFTGNRVGYDETKLWAHPNNAAAYQERIFIR
jgi:LruC domain-containing protein